MLKNENLFSDDTLLSQLEEPLGMDAEGLDFSSFNNSKELKDCKEFHDFQDPTVVKFVPNGNVILASTVTENTQQTPCVSRQSQQEKQQQEPQLQDVTSVQNRTQRISVTPAPTVFSSQYAIAQNVNFRYQSVVLSYITVSPDIAHYDYTNYHSILSTILFLFYFPN